MADAVSETWGRVIRWPRFLGAILLVAAVQSGIGGWSVGVGPVAAFLAGGAVTAGVTGLILLAVPLPDCRRGSKLDGTLKTGNAPPP